MVLVRIGGMASHHVAAMFEPMKDGIGLQDYKTPRIRHFREREGLKMVTLTSTLLGTKMLGEPMQRDRDSFFLLPSSLLSLDRLKMTVGKQS